MKFRTQMLERRDNYLARWVLFLSVSSGLMSKVKNLNTMEIPDNDSIRFCLLLLMKLQMSKIWKGHERIVFKERDLSEC